MDEPQETVGGKAAAKALDALRYDWGSAYEIENADGEWRARRLDGLGDWIEAEIPDDLRNQILSDFALKPVRPQGCEAEILRGSGNDMPYKPVKDQVVRRMIFSAAHPEVNFAFQRSTGRWGATYPDRENGTQTVRRLELRELLDELEERFG
jgi:hypothetical protein